MKEVSLEKEMRLGIQEVAGKLQKQTAFEGATGTHDEQTQWRGMK